MSPTHTDNLKTNLSEAGGHLKQAATDTAEAVRGAASAAGEEIRLGRANLKADLADGLLTIELVREVPEAMKPKKIAVNGGQLVDINKDRDAA